ncbi:MAG: hypothetical protein D6758_08710 [Gammaproteobacteria bacterium]|nr:MAG: hypothetical protein D6758_08710 [Gammaproteobacteria bacterium]
MTQRKDVSRHPEKHISLARIQPGLGDAFNQPAIPPLRLECLERLFRGLPEQSQVVAFRLSAVSGIVPLLYAWAGSQERVVQLGGRDLPDDPALVIVNDHDWGAMKAQGPLPPHVQVAVVGSAVSGAAFQRAVSWSGIRLGSRDLQALYESMVGGQASVHALFSLRLLAGDWPLAAILWLDICRAQGRWIDFTEVKSELFGALSRYPEVENACRQPVWSVLARLESFDQRYISTWEDEGVARQFMEGLEAGIWPTSRLRAHTGWWQVSPLFSLLLGEQGCLTPSEVQGRLAGLAERLRASEDWFGWYDLVQRFRLSIDHASALALPASVVLDRGGGWHEVDLAVQEGEPDIYLMLRQAWSLALAGRLNDSQALMADLSEPEDLGHGALYWLVRGFLARSEGDLQAAESALIKCNERADARPDLSILAHMLQGSILAARGEHARARDANRKALREARRQRLYGLEVLVLYDLARIELSEGYLHQAQLALRLASEAFALRQARLGPMRGMIPCRLNAMRMVEAWCRYDRTWLLDAGADILAQTERSRDLTVLIVCIVLSRLEKAQGRYDDAELLLSHAERLMQFWRVDERLYQNLLAVLRADIQIDRGRQDIIGRSIEQIEQTLHETRYPELFPLLPGYFRVAQIKYMIMLGQYERAGKALNRLDTSLANQSPFSLGNVFVHLLRALLYQETGKQVEARAALREAFRVAETEGYVSAFVEFARVLAPSLRHYLKAPAGSRFAEQVLNEVTPMVGDARDEVPPLEEPLSSRELAVLQLIAEGCSNKEIGERLFISLHTVKTHARRINTKLHVKNRTQAIARARELGLL